MAEIWPLISSKLFKFLIFEGKEIGYCFSMLDFNQILTDNTDLKNYTNLFFKRGKINRGRIISSGIIKEFQGKKLFKIVRNEILLEFFNRGIHTIESSYIDCENSNSIGNVSSKGAIKSREYALFTNS